MYTRRDFAKIALTSLPLVSGARASDDKAPKFSSKVNGVQVGAQTYCYRALRTPREAPLSLSGQEQLIDRIAASVAEDKIDCAEFWIALVEPAWIPYDYGNGGKIPTDPQLVKNREALRQWRKSRPMELFKYARKKFNDAGVNIYSCMFNFNDTLDEDEIECGFAMAKALGTEIITANPTVASTKRLAPFADRHKVKVGIHNHNFITDPNEIASTASLVSATKLSPYVYVTLDIGHFVAAGEDPVKFLRDHHNRIINVHLKDRHKNDPRPHADDNTVEWGAGDAPIKQVLQLMKKEKYTFPATIEYEYPGKGTAVEEVRKCYEYIKAALA
jgi:sugar phosphate isomerase/epimerase